MARVVAVVVVVVVQLSVVMGRSLAPGKIGYRSSLLPSGLHHIEATDGAAALSAMVSRDRGFITCLVSHSQATAQAMMDDPGTLFVTIGEQQVHDMWKRCVTAASDKKAARRTATRDAEGGAVPFEPDYTAGNPEGHGAHIAIVPGTNWCGYGNAAASYEDLGPHNETDACCRTHDHCPYFIDGLSTKYHYTNTKPWTLSACDCDTALYHCFKRVNNGNANTVGEIFFGVLGVQCFEFQSGEYCAHYHWTHLWCQDHDTGPMAVVRDFPFHWPDDVDDSALVGR